MYDKPDKPNGSFCMDCGVNTSEIREFYMLQDEVWLRAVPGRLGMLCIQCVEARLDRKLRPRDFDPDWDFMSVGNMSTELRARFLGLPSAYERTKPS